MLHTHKAKWRGDGRVAHRSKGFRPIINTKTQYKCSRGSKQHRDQMVTVVCNLAGGLEVHVGGWGGNRMSEVVGSAF